MAEEKRPFGPLVGDELESSYEAEAKEHAGCASVEASDAMLVVDVFEDLGF